MGSSGSEAGASGSVLLLSPLTLLPFPPEALAGPLQRAFGTPLRVEPILVDVQATWDAGRNQYHSTSLLRQLRDERPARALRLVGLVDVDLYVPILTYVFGEAQLDGPVAVVSSFRLREPWVEGGAEPAVFWRRLVKTVMHELGHTFGLRHCTDPSCVMASAASLEMLDEKGDDFCLRCKAQVRERLAG
jgi:archaemetzincin